MTDWLRGVAAALLAGTLCTGALAGPVLWLSDSDGTLSKVDVGSGQLAHVGEMRVPMTDIAFDPSGGLWGIGFHRLYRIDRDSAAVSVVGSFAPTLNSLVFSADGTLYAASNALYTVDPRTAALTRIGTGTYQSSGDLAFIGERLYLSSSAPVADTLYLIDALTGAGTLVGPIGAPNVFGMATDNNVDLYGLSGNRILRIDTATGAGRVVQTYKAGILAQTWGTAFVTEAIARDEPATEELPRDLPEPSTLALVGAAALACAALGRRGCARHAA